MNTKRSLICCFLAICLLLLGFSRPAPASAQGPLVTFDFTGTISLAGGTLGGVNPVKGGHISGRFTYDPSQPPINPGGNPASYKLSFPSCGMSLAIDGVSLTPEKQPDKSCELTVQNDGPSAVDKFEAFYYSQADGNGLRARITLLGRTEAISSTALPLSLPLTSFYSHQGYVSDGGGASFAYFNMDTLELVVPVPAVTAVTIDIKPGASPNSVNLGSNGVVPVAILSTATFDATTVDPTTVTLAGAAVALKRKGDRMSSVEDINGDGWPDLVLHFSTQDLQLSEGDTLAILEGKTFGGEAIRGTDLIRIVPE